MFSWATEQYGNTEEPNPDLYIDFDQWYELATNATEKNTRGVIRSFKMLNLGSKRIVGTNKQGNSFHLKIQLPSIFAFSLANSDSVSKPLSKSSFKSINCSAVSR